jgi:hypothetical protein
MMITLYKADKCGRLRFFIVHDLQRSLLGAFSLTIAGSIGDKPRKDVMHLFDSETDRSFWLKRVLSRKKRAGYKELYSYGSEADGIQAAGQRSTRRAG